MPVLRLMFPLVLTGGAAALVLSAGSIRISPYDPVGGRLFPLSIAWAMLVLALLYLATETWRLNTTRRAPEAKSAGPSTQPPMPVVRALAVLGLFALAVALVSLHLIGLVAAIMIVVVVGSLLLVPAGVSGPGLAVQVLSAVAAAAILFALSQLLVVQTLGIRLP